MRVFSLIVLLLLLLVSPAVLYADNHAEELEEGDPLAMYRVYKGEWDSVTKTSIPTDEEPVEFETKGRWIHRDILGGAMIEVKGAAEMNGELYQYMLLYGYDEAEKTHVCWFHDQQGVHMRMHGDWSEEDKEMTWTLADDGQQATAITIVDDLSDPDRISFTFNLESQDGKVLMTQAGYAIRAEDE